MTTTEARTGDPRPGSEEGFGLIEVVVALGILVALSIATAPFFFRAFQSEASQGSRQAAVTVAGQRLDFTRSLSRTRLLSGRTQAAVAAITADRGLVNLSNDNLAGGPNASDLNYDPSNPGVATVPTLSTQTVGSTVFTVRTYIDPCYRSPAKVNATCTANSSNGTAILRISIDVSWNRIPGVTCSSARPGTCEFVTTTLRDATVSDPTFDRNVSAPTATGASSIPTPEHPYETATLSVTGTNFVAGAVISSDDAVDAIGPTGSNTGSSASATYTASGVVGNRNITITNPDGGNASVLFSVTQSAPTIASNGVTTPSPLTAGTSAVFTITGTDFYNSGVGGSTPPSVVVTEAGAALAGTVAASGTYTRESTTVTLDATHRGAVAFTVTVTNADGGTATFPLTLQVKGQPPTITSITANPLVGIAGSMETFTVAGTGFDGPPGPVVTVNEAGKLLPCAVSASPVPTSTGFTCVAVLNSTLVGIEAYTLTATNADASTVTSGTGTLTVVGVPTVTAFVLTSAPAIAGSAEQFTVTGTNLSAASGCSVKEGSAVLTGVISGATTSTAVCTTTLAAGLHGLQIFSVTVSSPAGSVTAPSQSYSVGPAITTMTITASGSNATVLTFGGAGFDTTPKSIVVTTPAFGGPLPGTPGVGTATSAVFNVPYSSTYFVGKNNFTAVVTNADGTTVTASFTAVGVS